MGSGNLTPYPIPSFQGGVNDFDALHGGMQEDESIELRNAVMDGVGRLNFRRGTRIRQVLLDEGSNEVDHVLGIWPFGTGTLALAWSDTFDKVYVYTSTSQDGTGFVRKADLYTSVTAVPRIKVQEINAGGGGTGSPDSTWPAGRRMYFVDPEGNLALKFYAQSNETVYTVQRDFGSGLVSLFPRAIAEFNYHLFTGGYQDDSYTGVEVIRYSTPGLVAADDENDGAVTNTFEWWLLDREAVGRPGEAVIAMGKAGGGMIVLKENNVHRWYGFDRETWGQHHLNGQFGAVSPDVVEANGWVYYMSPFGPCRTDGQGVEFIGGKIRQFISQIGDPAATVLVHNPLKFQVIYFFIWPAENTSYPTLGKAFSYLTNGWTDVDIFSAVGTYATIFGGGVVGTTSLPGPEGAPSNLAVTKSFDRATCKDTFTLTWTNGDTNPKTKTRIYELVQAAAPLDADWASALPIKEVASGVTSHGLVKDLNTVGHATKHWYQIRHTLNGQNSNWNGDTATPSATDVSIDTTSAQVQPNAPTGATGTDVSFCDGGVPSYQVKLDWTNAHDDQSGVFESTALVHIEGWDQEDLAWEEVYFASTWDGSGTYPTQSVTVDAGLFTYKPRYTKWRIRVSHDVGCTGVKYSSYTSEIIPTMTYPCPAVLVPDSDIVSADWLTNGSSELWQSVDDYPADDAATYIYPDITGADGQAELGMSGPFFTVDTGQTITLNVRLRARASGTVNARILLKEGGVTRDTWNLLDSPVAGVWTTYSRTLSAGVKSSISNWSNLSVELLLFTEFNGHLNDVTAVWLHLGTVTL